MSNDGRPLAPISLPCYQVDRERAKKGPEKTARAFLDTKNVTVAIRILSIHYLVSDQLTHDYEPVICQYCVSVRVPAK
jgi:hypothetical protein